MANYKREKKKERDLTDDVKQNSILYTSAGLFEESEKQEFLHA